MLDTQSFGSELKKLGFDFYSGVPCSFLKYLINYAINSCDYVMAANEGDAVATAAGAYLGGKKSVVLMQNSGLTNATSPLTSLNYSFRLPVLGFVSLRGEEGLGDEPQHELMGQITGDMLSLMQVNWEYLSTDMTETMEQLQRANASIERGETFFFVVKKGTFGEVLLNDQGLNEVKNERAFKSSAPPSLPSRTEALSTILENADKDTVFLATTGKTGRELFEVDDLPNNLYMVGSMGCISAMALGLALARPDKNVVAIDGDGAALMRLGSFATNAYYSPPNLIHILLDNNTHDSTGGQATVSHTISFSDIATASGYTQTIEATTSADLQKAMDDWKENKKLTFVHLRISKGSPKTLGRPTIKPYEVKERLMKFIGS